MKPPRSRLTRPACHLLLQITGLLLPRRERTEWLAEWKAELHYAFARELSNREYFEFCLGALPDALWLKRRPLRPVPILESPRRCLALLATFATVCVTISLLVPATRHKIFPAAYHVPRNLVVVSTVSAVTGSDVEVAASQYLAWNDHPHPALSQTAFYLPTVDQVHLGTRSQSWSVGRATAAFPALLHIHISKARLQTCRRSGIVPLVLSHETWVHQFASNPAIVGRTLIFRGWKARIVAIAPQAASFLPMQMDAWTIETSKSLHKLSITHFDYGFMLARTSSSFPAAPYIALTSQNGVTSRLFPVPLSSFAAYRVHQPIIRFFLFLLLTCLVLPGILFVSQRTGLVPERLSLRLRTRSGLFLLAKLALLLPTLFCGPVLLAHWLPSSGFTDFLMPVAAWVFSVFWAIDDQRQRCPHCLRKLSSPARVGDASHTFLSFSGIELLCSEGHGLLHIPDYPTSWFRTHRWLPLDASWRGLFPSGM